MISRYRIQSFTNEHKVKLNDGSNDHSLAISLSTTNGLVGEFPTDELYSVKQRLEAT